MPAIGFALLTYDAPAQVVRLVARLRALYGPEAPIAIHHNFDQTPLDPSALPPDVRFVRPHLATGWGTWNTVEATLRALRLLYEGGDGPEFVVLLSGSDYPTVSASRALADLRGARADAFIHARPVVPFRREQVVAGPLGLGVNEGASNQEVCYRRYYSSIYRVGGLRVRIRSPLLAPLLSPFSRSFGCYAGEHWWTLGRRGAEHLLDARERRPDLVEWFSVRHIPEEAFVHTVVSNASGLRVDARTFRFIDWSSRARSPRMLGVSDVPRIGASGAHFARKFAPDDPALDALDAALGLPPWRAPGDAIAR